jgi:hypothetical protein
VPQSHDEDPTEHDISYPSHLVAAVAPRQSVQVNVVNSRAAHSLGIASLVVGILSFFVCWLPFIGFGFAGLALVLGVSGILVAIVRKGTGIGYSIAGTGVSVVSLLFAGLFSMFYAGTVASVDRAIEMGKEAPIPQAKSVVPPANAGQIVAPKLVPERDVADKADNPAENVAEKRGNAAADKPVVAGADKADPPWPDASQPLRLGDVQVEITRVVVGRVPLWQEIIEEDAESENVLLTVWLKITNNSETKKIDYSGYMGDLSSVLDIDADLTDSFENTYRNTRFSATLKVKDADTNASIYPGKSHVDAVVFEPPVDAIEYLRLTLSAKAFGGDGEFRFQIPKKMIQRP